MFFFCFVPITRRFTLKAFRNSILMDGYFAHTHLSLNDIKFFSLTWVNDIHIITQCQFTCLCCAANALRKSHTIPYYPIYWIKLNSLIQLPAAYSIQRQMCVESSMCSAARIQIANGIQYFRVIMKTFFEKTKKKKK